ncbi:HD domain-containing protein [Aldersonia sp. NBC_00410]|uniref:HD domain-containing protein n=1 Tax=Aldersonia sp. NBC_00410 TaxID=2975954 RepID=UPI002256A284|nr:HD domain-containing protein [Aldersonia sp. NBC_00410]MCX5042361.1 HD domain-containing protein [Aldersonia sp. NBC_00410]MCX5042384.1 HD domain-containing protein [Aldersonia sp. NBC_00410]
MVDQAKPSSLVPGAQALTRRLLVDDPARVEHISGVAARAVALSGTVDVGDRDTLVATAWLHDLGYAQDLKDIGFHPINGARYLRARGWPPLVCELVAHHSGARFVAAVRGFDAELAEFGFVQDALTDALTIADQTSGPHGQTVTVDQGLRDMLDRHGPDSPNARAHPQREPYIRAALARVEDHRSSGAPDPDRGG